MGANQKNQNQNKKNDDGVIDMFMNEKGVYVDE